MPEDTSMLGVWAHHRNRDWWYCPGCGAVRATEPGAHSAIKHRCEHYVPRYTACIKLLPGPAIAALELMPRMSVALANLPDVWSPCHPEGVEWRSESRVP